MSHKLLEHMYSNVIGYLDHNNIITDVQHGFRSKQSQETQLITVKYNCCAPLALKGQREEYQSTQNLLHQYQH